MRFDTHCLKERSQSVSWIPWRKEHWYSPISSGEQESDKERQISCYHNRKKYLTWQLFALLACSILSLITVISISIHIRNRHQSDKPCLHNFSGKGRREAVKCLFEKAKRRHDTMRRYQSPNLESAISEYTKRYRRAPPKGFESWYKWSKDRNVKIVDDYDQIEASLAPFRPLSPLQMYKALERVTDREDVLATIEFKSGKVLIPGDPERDQIKAMYAMLSPIAPYLPDLRFVLNWDDREILKGAKIEAGQESKDPKALDYSSSADGWSFLTASCPTMHLSASSFVERPELNLCDNVNNSELINARGDLQQGERGISNLVPIMSWSKYATSRDILVPYWAASSPFFRGWNRERGDTSFEKKKKVLYWRGSSTGPSMSASRWRQNYRVRFVQYIHMLTASLARRMAFALEEPIAKLGPLGIDDSQGSRQILAHGLHEENFDVRFTSTTQCDKEHLGCDILKQNLGLAPYVDSASEHDYQFLWDIDGNSMSARFYRLLRSNAVVFKQTLFGEWHDDRLLAWYHYVPIFHTGLKDVPLLLDFFINDHQGRKIAKQIAAHGRKAEEDTFRLEDLSSFWFRLLIEYHSLFGPQLQPDRPNSHDGKSR